MNLPTNLIRILEEDLSYAISVIESIPMNIRSYMEDKILDETIEIDRLRRSLSILRNKLKNGENL